MKVKIFWKKNPVKFSFKSQQKIRSYFVRFFGWDKEDDNSLEDDVNAWLQEHPNIEIKNLLQSATGGSWGSMLWSISVWYEEK